MQLSTTYQKFIDKILPYLFAIASFGLMVRISNIDFNAANPASLFIFDFLTKKIAFNLSLIKLFDLLIVIILFLIIYSVKFKKLLITIKSDIKQWIIYFSFILIFLIIGQIIGFLNTGAYNLPDVWPHFLRTLFNFFVFIAVLIIFTYDKKLIRCSMYAIIISPIVMLPIFLGYFKNDYLNAGYRLTGTMVNPQNLAIWLAISFILGLAFLLQKPEAWKKTLLGLWLSIISCFILWTLTRGVILALFVSILIAVILLLKNKNPKNAFLLLLITIITFTIGYLLIPPKSQTVLVSRTFNTQQINVNIGENTISTTEIYNSTPKGMFTDPIRLKIWGKDINLIISHPFGLGFNYLIIKPHQLPEYLFYPSFTVNTFLEIALAGGWGALIIFIIMIIKIFTSSIKYFKKDDYISWAWSFSLLTFLMASLFTDHFLFRNLWFILGGTAGIYLSKKYFNENTIC